MTDQTNGLKELTPELLNAVTDMVTSYATDADSEYQLLYVVGDDLPTEEMLYTREEYENFSDDYEDYDPPDDLFQVLGHDSDGNTAILYAPHMWEQRRKNDTLDLLYEPEHCHEVTKIPLENIETVVGLDGFDPRTQANPLYESRNSNE